MHKRKFPNNLMKDYVMFGKCSLSRNQDVMGQSSYHSVEEKKREKKVKLDFFNKKKS